MAGGRALDFNLLLALQALLEERNITRAARRASSSQASMSAALAKLRAHYSDELLVRTGRSYELTPLARDLLPQVVDTLGAVSAALAPGSLFDPATSRRRFTVSGSDYALAVIVEPLLTLLAREAPEISVDFDPLPSPGQDLTTHLVKRDLVIGALGYGLPGGRQIVFSDRFVCIVSADNPRLDDGRLSLDDLRSMPHAGASFGGSSFTPADELLLEAGVQRRVAVTAPGLLTLPFVVAGSDLCAFVPERLLRRCPPGLGIVTAEVPLDDPEIVEAAHWNQARQADPSVSWLRKVLAKVAGILAEE
ncbi:LysR substrate-binding domain-containing protein, partial [Streptomyces sp. NPDC006356]